jgi:hypothetical protein
MGDGTGAARALLRSGIHRNAGRDREPRPAAGAWPRPRGAGEGEAAPGGSALVTSVALLGLLDLLRRG